MANTRKIVREPTVTVRMEPGETTEYRKRLWTTFWTRLLAKVRSELNADSEIKGENKTKV